MAFPNSDRLNFRNMTDDDLECMAEMLGDPEVMAFYLGRKLRKRRRPGSTGTRRTPELKVGYHVRADMQGRGYATEAAAACRDFARDVLQESHLVAIIHPDNDASRRVAEKIGLHFEEDDRSGAIDVRSVYGAPL